MIKINWKILIFSLILVYLIAFLGSLFTDTGDWYESIKPKISPPNYVFPVVWNILFFLIALSLYFSYVSKKKNKKPIIIVFCVNLFLNFLWSVIFFGLKMPVLAFFELILLLISILFMFFIVYEYDKKAFYLLIPYLLWVLFAGVLNFLIAFS